MRMQIAADLKQRINDRELTLGVLGTDHVWPGLVPLLRSAGLHYLIVDMEHGSHSTETVEQICTIARHSGFAVLIRVVSADYSIVRKAVDLGPCGLMLPCTETPEQLDAIRDAIWMPPRGKRRPGGMGNHWMDDFNYTTWKRDFEDHFIVLPQIESQLGLTNLKAIAEHEVVTAMAIGPYDLSADLGCCWEPDNPKLVEALQQIRAAGDAAGKNTWMLGDGAQLKADGYSFICLAEPSALLKITLKKQVGELFGQDMSDLQSVVEHG